jgi:hypothetical protein
LFLVLPTHFLGLLRGVLYSQLFEVVEVWNEDEGRNWDFVELSITKRQKGECNPSRIATALYARTRREISPSVISPFSTSAM